MRQRPRTGALVALLAISAASVSAHLASAAPLPDAPDCALFGADTHWNQPVTDLPVHANSTAWIDAIGRDDVVHPDFGAGMWEGAPIGIPWTVVDGDQPRVAVSFLYDDESDPGPYPIPPDAPIEGGPDGDGDRHVLVVDRDACVLYELYDAHPDADGSWQAGSGAVFDLADDRLRPDGWTSADAAGLPILPGLVRDDEVVAGVIDHAIRFTAPRTARDYVWPARHQAGRDGTDLPPMGIRVRLRPDVDLSGFSPQARVVAEALKEYGAILADNGSPWFLSGAPGDGFDDGGLRDLRQLTGDDFEVVDTAGWILDPDSRLVADAASDTTVGRISGSDRIATAVEVSRFAFGESDSVVIARSDQFADALAATPLAAALGAPVLLTAPDRLDDRVLAEVERLGATRVDLVGGTGALSPEVAQAFGPDREVHRWSGPDRFATAAAVSDAAVAVWTTTGIERAGEVAVVALGAHADPDRAWPDALAAGVDAAVRRARLVLVAPDRVPEASRGQLDHVSEAFVAGGPGAIPDDVVGDLGVPATRVRGPDRVATAIALADHALQGRAPAVVLVASARRFPDALAAGAAAAAQGGVLVLTEPDDAPAVLRDRVRSWGAPTHVVGGTSVVTERVRRSLA